MLYFKIKKLLCFFLFMSVFSIPVHADNVLLAQELLTKLGYTPGPIDGSYGAKTKYALDNYYAAQNKKFDGKLDKNEIIDLKTTLKNSVNLKPKLKKSRHIQHVRYSKDIATTFRGLKVNEDS